MKKYLTRYGISRLIYLTLNVIRTKIFYRKSRLIRFPFDIRNKHFIDLGRGLTTGVGCRIEAHPIDPSSTKKCLIFGNNIEINDYVHIVASQSVKIGNDVLMASKIFISDLNHGCYDSESLEQSSPDSKPNDRPFSAKPVLIEDNVWIGESVSILPGVTIGKGAIIGANSVVSKDIPQFVIAVGAPAKAIKKYNFDKRKWEKI
jgi:lipopolysaccharide O-acetyltransferase